MHGIEEIEMFKGLWISLQFFTSLPINKQIPMNRDNIDKCIKSIPLLGLFQGVLYSLLLYFLIEWTPFSYVAIAFLVWLFTIILTGGIHLDGWMDTSDAFFSYQNKEKRLEIMNDPRTGAFGVLSVIVLLSSRFLFLYEITSSLQMLSFMTIICIPFLSKVVIGSILLTVPAAKEEGLAHFFKQAAKQHTWIIYLMYVLIFIGFSIFLYRHSMIPLFILVLAAFLCFLFIRRKAVKWFGGITGDVLGATGEGTENFLWMTLWLLHYFVMG